MNNEKILPDFIFEASWEVCNKVGGIYTVLSTRAKTLQDVLKDKVIFIYSLSLYNEYLYRVKIGIYHARNQLNLSSNSIYTININGQCMQFC